jgi:AhpC/TSA family
VATTSTFRVANQLWRAKLRWPLTLTLLCPLFSGVSGSRAFSASPGQTAQPPALDTDVLDASGRRIDPFHGSPSATVFLFVRTDCPISNRYAPEIRRLKREFSARGVAFWLVYPDARATGPSVQEHEREFHFECAALRDPKHELVKMTGVQVTPEAAVFALGRRMVYRGRIDDWYVDFGRARPAPTTHDLEDALRAVVAGKPVPLASTQAVGCYISDLP